MGCRRPMSSSGIDTQARCRAGAANWAGSLRSASPADPRSRSRAPRRSSPYPRARAAGHDRRAEDSVQPVIRGQELRLLLVADFETSGIAEPSTAPARFAASDPVSTIAKPGLVRSAVDGGTRCGTRTSWRSCSWHADERLRRCRWRSPPVATTCPARGQSIGDRNTILDRTFHLREVTGLGLPSRACARAAHTAAMVRETLNARQPSKSRAALPGHVAQRG